MRSIHLAMAALALTGCDGCMGTKAYSFREIPFCASDSPGVHPSFAADYRVLVKHGGDFQIDGLRRSGRSQLRTWHDDVLFAVVECPAASGPASAPRSIQAAEEMMKEFDDDHVPHLCPGRKVIVHQRLEAETDERSEALGHGGFFRFPEAPLACAAGTLERRDRHTLGDILYDFGESVEAYELQHEGSLPRSLEELEAATKLPPLPPDPWGRPLAFQSSSGRVVLMSAGPDKAPGTADDVEVLSQERGSRRHVLGFPGSDYWPYGDYAKFVSKP